MELYINDRLVTLYPDTKISWEIYNPLFNDMGSYSYPVSAPLEPNRAILNHADDSDNFTPVAPTFRLVVNGEPFADGDVVFTDTVGSFEFYLKAGKSSVASILKTSYLDDETINGVSMGENPFDIAGLNASIDKVYPETAFTVVPIMGGDVVMNEYDSYNNKLFGKNIESSIDVTEKHYLKVEVTDPDDNVLTFIESARIAPMVYLRHVLKTAVKALGLKLVRDDFAAAPDANRILIFCPKYTEAALESEVFYDKWNYEWVDMAHYRKVANWLPHITVADFFKDLPKRFGIAVYYSELDNVAEIIKLDDVFSLSPLNYSAKFIGNEETDPMLEYQVSHINKTGGNLSKAASDLLGVFIDVASFNDIWSNIRVPDNTGNFFGYFDQKLFRTIDNNRFYKVLNPKIDGDFSSKKYYINDEWYADLGSIIDLPPFYIPINWGGIWYSPMVEQSSLERNDAVTAEISKEGTAATQTFVRSFLFPAIEGRVSDNLTIRDLVIKTDLPEPVTIRIVVRELMESGESIMLAYVDFEISNTTYTETVTNDLATYERPILRDFYIPIDKTSTKLEATRRLYWDISFNHPTQNRTVSMMYWNRTASSFTSWETSAYIDYARPVPTEINPHAPFVFGTPSTTDSIEKVEPVSILPTMTRQRLRNIFEHGYLFQIPATEIEPAADNADYAYLIYRGKINDEVEGLQRAPFASLDDNDMDGAPFADRLANPVEPQLSLRWDGPRGLVKQLHANSTVWRSKFKRRMVKRLALTQSDITNNRLYQPIEIDGQRYIINRISVEVSADGTLSAAKVEMFTM